MQTLEEPINAALETEYKELKQLAESHDAGLDSAEKPSENRAPEVDVKPSNDSTQTQEQPQTKSDAEPVKTETAKPEEEKQSEYQKKRSRAQERIEELAKEKNELKALVENLQKQVTEIKSKPAQTISSDKPKYTKEFLKSVIKQFEEEGDEAHAKLAREELGKVELYELEQNKLKEQEDKQANEKKQAEEKDKFMSEWRNHVDAEIKSNPDLEKDDSPLSQTVKQFLQDPRFSMRSDGFKEAVQLSKWKINADSVPGLKQKISELEQEIKRLNNVTSLATGGDPTPAPSEVDFDKMTMEQQRTWLEAQAQRQE